MLIDPVATSAVKNRRISESSLLQHDLISSNDTESRARLWK